MRWFALSQIMDHDEKYSSVYEETKMQVHGGRIEWQHNVDITHQLKSLDHNYRTDKHIFKIQ